jgi:hypothetical protein
MKADIPYGRINMSGVTLAGMLENTKAAIDVLSSLEDLLFGTAAKDIDPLTQQVAGETLAGECLNYLHTLQEEAEKLLLELPNGKEIIDGTDQEWRARSDELREMQNARLDKGAG